MVVFTRTPCSWKTKARGSGIQGQPPVMWFKVMLYCQETPSQKERESQVVVVRAFNTSTQEAEAGRSLEVRGQPGLQELVSG